MKMRNFGAAFAALLAKSSPALARTQPARNVVLVPGAFTDKSSWDKVADLLRAKGYRVSEVDRSR